MMLQGYVLKTANELAFVLACIKLSGVVWITCELERVLTKYRFYLRVRGMVSAHDPWISNTITALEACRGIIPRDKYNLNRGRWCSKNRFNIHLWALSFCSRKPRDLRY